MTTSPSLTFAEIFEFGGHKNSLGRSEEVLHEVLTNKARLTELYSCISNDDAWVRMRAMDTLEKILRQNPDWVEPFLADMFNNLILSKQASIQWHLAQIFRQVDLSTEQKQQAVDWLAKLLSSTEVDWIVAANAMDTLRYFQGEGKITKSEFKRLLKVQLRHKSRSVVKKARKHLDAL